MPATLIPIEGARTEDLTERQLWKEMIQAEGALDDALVAAGVIQRAWAHGDTRIGELYRAFKVADMRRVSHAEARVRKLEMTLRRILASDVLTDEQRQAILNGLYGSTARDCNLLSKYEANLVDAYRRIDDAGKQMLRTLFARLVATSEPTIAADEKGGKS